MSIFYRINRGIRVGIEAARRAPNMAAVSKTLDTAIAEGTLKTIPEISIEKEAPVSKLDIRDNPIDLTYGMAYGSLRQFFSKRTKHIPPYGVPERDVYLSDFYRMEPILAGAVYSMSAKMSALSWIVSGPRLKAMKAARLFARAAHMGGQDWGGFLSSTAQDFYTTNNGVFWETARDSAGLGNLDSLAGPLADIGHIDSLSCNLTGNADLPMIYISEVLGQTLRFKEGEYIHFASLPSPRERHLGIGFCAVDRAYRAAKLLIGLHDYDEEKLNNLPPEGVAAVTGLTMDEFQDALLLWKLSREKDQSLTFPQVLWLIGSQPNAEVKVDFVGFSNIPESFERDAVMSHYISTLALCFGVDAREFWPISSGSLGTASESEIQHLKAKGKGPGEFISTAERMLNGELPPGVNFVFDTQDIEEDQNAASVAKAWVDVFYPLYQGAPAGQSGGQPPALDKEAPSRTQETEQPKPPKKGMPADQQPKPSQQKPGGFPTGMPGNFGAPQVEQVLTKDELIRLLVDKRVLPEYLINDERVSVYDSEVHLTKENQEDDVKFIWSKGILKEVRVNPIIIHSTLPQDSTGSIISDALEIQDSGADKILEYLKQKETEIFESKRDINGKPIPEGEVVRGASVTRTTIRDEIERWKKHPVLSHYVPTDEELEKLLSGGK